MENQSPLPQEVEKIEAEVLPLEEGMSFYQALVKLSEGHRITRLDWANEKDYGVLHDNRVKIHKSQESDAILHDWIISLNDLSATDWVITYSN